MNTAEITWKEFSQIEDTNNLAYTDKWGCECYLLETNDGLYLELCGKYYGPLKTQLQAIEICLEYITCQQDRYHTLREKIIKVVQEEE